MTRLTHAWRALQVEQRAAAVAALALLATMFLPWYGLQSLNRRTGTIYSHDINAFGDVSFVEAAIFLVAAGVLAMLFARGEGRRFQLPGSDGTIVLIAGVWAALLIFYRVFSRPAGGGYPVGIEWGFFMAFVAAGALAYAGLRMRTLERPQPPLTRGRSRRRRAAEEPDEAFPVPRRAAAQPEEPAQAPRGAAAERTQEPFRAAGRPAAEQAGETLRAPRRGEVEDAPDTVVVQRQPRRRSSAVPARERPPYPPAPPEQLSFEDPPTRAE